MLLVNVTRRRYFTLFCRRQLVNVWLIKPKIAGPGFNLSSFSVHVLDKSIPLFSAKSSEMCSIQSVLCENLLNPNLFRPLLLLSHHFTVPTLLRFHLCQFFVAPRHRGQDGAHGYICLNENVLGFIKCMNMNRSPPL